MAHGELIVDELLPSHVRQRETFNFVKLQGAERQARIDEWRRMIPLVRQLLAQPYDGAAASGASGRGGFHRALRIGRPVSPTAMLVQQGLGNK